MIDQTMVVAMVMKIRPHVPQTEAKSWTHEYIAWKSLVYGPDGQRRVNSVACAPIGSAPPSLEMRNDLPS